MTNSKSTKRALFGSLMAMLLCVTMLIGSTFAWFTDTASTGVNKIMAGNLDVELYLKDNSGNYQNISANKEPIFGSYDSTKAQDVNIDTLWEPGKTQVAYLKIANKGNLALKYKVALNTINPAESKDLYKVMQYQIVPDAQANATWTAGAGKSVTPGTAIVSAEDVQMLPGAEHYFALLIHMDENAGNEYMNGKVEFDINVLATQLNAEKDSFGTDYDIDSMYAAGDGLYIDNTDGSYVALTTKGLTEVSKLASDDDSITSVKYNNEEVPVVRDAAALDSAISADNSVVVITDGNYTVDTAKNTTVTIVGNGENTNLSIESEGEHNTDYGFDGSTVVFENLTFNVGGYLNGYARMNATYNNCIINGTYTLNGKSVFNNCVFNKTGDDYCVWTWGAPTAEFNNCTFNSDGKAILMYGGANTVLKLTNCTLNDSGVISGKAAIETGSDWSTDTKEIILTNCTINGFDKTEQKSLVWGGTNLGTNVWGNKNLLPTDRLNVVINGVDVY